MTNKVITPRKTRKMSARKNAHPIIHQTIGIFNESTYTTEVALSKAGVSKNILNSWARGANATIGNLEAVLNVLGYRLAIEPLPEPGAKATSLSAQT